MTKKILSCYSNIKEMKRIYLDYAATTPLDPAVRRAITPYLSDAYGNPSSLHSFGQEASVAVFGARRTIAGAIGADYREIVFTGSATEANNVALRGAIRGAKRIAPITDRHEKRFALRPSRRDESRLDASRFARPRIIISAIEHESVAETARDLQKEGVEVVSVPVSREGLVDLKVLHAALDRRTVLVSIMYANNEVGSIQPISEISALIRNFRNKILKSNRNYQLPRLRRSHSILSDYSVADYPLFHTDAAQALPYLSTDVNELGVDLMTLSAHKVYGPKGMGALYVRKNKNLSNGFIVPIITGGGQEFGLRSGTENVAGIVGFGEAVRLLNARAQHATKEKRLRDYFWQKLKAFSLGVVLNGPALDGPRLPNNLNISFPGVKAQEFLIKLDLAGVAASAGPACAARSSESSPTLRAMGYDSPHVVWGIRFALGRGTTEGQIDTTLRIIKNLLTRTL